MQTFSFFSRTVGLVIPAAFMIRGNLQSADTVVDDSHWFVIPENASFVQHRDYMRDHHQKERIRHDKKHSKKTRAHQRTAEENARVTKFREQYEKTYE